MLPLRPVKVIICYDNIFVFNKGRKIKIACNFRNPKMILFIKIYKMSRKKKTCVHYNFNEFYTFQEPSSGIFPTTYRFYPKAVL